MPKQPNPFLRTFIPTILVLGGVAVAWAVYRQSKPAPVAPPAAQAPATTAPAAAPPPIATSTPVSADPAPPGTTPAQTVTIQLPPVGWTLSPLVYASDVGQSPAPLGDNDKGSPHKLKVEFSNGGAGVKSIVLADHFTSIREGEHIQVQGQLPIAEGQEFSALVPMAALAVEVTPPAIPGGVAVPQSVNLYANTAGPIWRNLSPGVFEATVIDESQKPVLKVTRRFSLSEGSYTLKLVQSVENVSPYPLSVRTFQMGPVEMPAGDVSYGGDKRRFRFGYLLPPAKDPTQQQVVSDQFVLTHSGVLGSRDDSGFYKDTVLWPTDETRADGLALVWIGTSDRYYSVAVHPIAPVDAAGAQKTLRSIDHVSRVVADGGKGLEFVGLRLDSTPTTLNPAGSAGSTTDIALAVYAGPTDKTVIGADALSSSMGLKGLLVYNFGGPCGFCTFPVLTHGILSILHLLHDYVFKDWSLAIIFLVVIVRTLLHPVTKWSQVKIARFGKQMQGMAPKQKELQEKYKDDPKKFQAEMARLWREEGISPTGMLGCVPMFLQMPIWIALSATLYFAVELRHQNAFYSLFQKIQPQSSPFWQFLGDLAEPDRLLYAGRTLFTVPILGPISSLNILPLLLGIVFYMQQKYIQQPTTAQTPEQEMQMKMMKWMSVIMFPLFMYNAPAGLSLYFTVNSTFAILESKWIRSHMDKHGLLDLDKMKTERAAKRGTSKDSGQGFFAKLQRAMEEKQKQAVKGQMKNRK
ncbi:MAG TPA: membrane protein insertase YidC [Phycisphaerales bacterium]|nr:membrane protein insertase YidC [Phycisphaerales bacterium]